MLPEPIDCRKQRSMFPETSYRKRGECDKRSLASKTGRSDSVAEAKVSCPPLFSHGVHSGGQGCPPHPSTVPVPTGRQCVVSALEPRDFLHHRLNQRPQRL